MKRVAISQSNYIPWKGYFDQIAAVDEFILFDDAQYTRRDWRNRNVIKTPQGPRWLTIPVKTKGRYYQPINETEAVGIQWRVDHWRALQQNYAKAPFFPRYADTFGSLYLGSQDLMLSRINYNFLSTVCALLGIRTKVSWSTDYGGQGSKTARLIGLCKAAGASLYFSGPSARDYIEPQLFKDSGVALEFMDYSGYPPYRQLHGEFDHAVSVLDLIFNVGADAPKYMKHVVARGARS